MLSTLAAIALTAAIPAQPADDAPAFVDNPYITYSDPKDWVVEMTARVFPDGRFAQQRTFQGWTFADFAMVLPFVAETATSRASKPQQRPDQKDGLVNAGLLINGYVANQAQIPVRSVSGTGVSYAFLELTGSGSIASAVGYIQSRVTSVETEFNQEAAFEIPWPATFGQLSAWLERDPTFDAPHPSGTDHVQQLLDAATDGNDPKQIPPVKLAKYLTGYVLEQVRTTGSNTQSPLGGNGFRVPAIDNPAGIDVPRSVIVINNSIGGFNVKNASEFARSKVGSEHDLANLLTAVFRRAGLPARTVIGIDNDESGDDLVKSWVEFAIVADDLDDPLWIPIDVWELESDGRSTRNWQQTWEHFGTSDLLREIAPIAHYFHPPANYRSYHLPGLFGIRSAAELPEFGTQTIHFEINGASKRGGQKPRP